MMPTTNCTAVSFIVGTFTAQPPRRIGALRFQMKTR